MITLSSGQIRPRRRSPEAATMEASVVCDSVSGQNGALVLGVALRRGKADLPRDKQLREVTVSGIRKLHSCDPEK